MVRRPVVDGTAGAMALIAEEPLAIRVQGRPYAVIMRTPGAEREHAAGFCLAEGIVDQLSDIATIASCDDGDTNVVTVTVTAERAAAIAGHLDRREYISQSSCGLCGKTLVDELHQEISPLVSNAVVSSRRVEAFLLDLPRHQPLRDSTRAAHAAAIYDLAGNLLAVAEDVGRHNALDKAVGSLFLDGRLGAAALVILSSRISYELVQKVARARIPIVAAHSRPTALSVRLAERLNITLTCLANGSGLLVFCGNRRLAGD